MPQVITDLIDQWPSRRAMAAEIGTKEDTVHRWAQRGRIPSTWMEKVVIAARNNGLRHVTPAWMIAVHNPDNDQ